MEPLLLTFEQAAEALQVHVAEVELLTETGRLPIVNIGPHRRIDVEDLREMIRLSKEGVRRRRPSGTGAVYQKANGDWKAKYRYRENGQMRIKYFFSRVSRQALMDKMLRWINSRSRDDGKPVEGYVYFVQEQGGGRIKIGFSTVPKQRVQQLQVDSAVPLQLLCVVPGMTSLEKQLHAKFDHLRVSGEWFKPNDELMAFIRSFRVRVKRKL